jgi:hypothetical protein
MLWKVNPMTRTTAFTHFALGLTLMAGGSARLHAQSPSTGELRGTVVDASGAMISRAQITISTPAGHSRKLKSGANGCYDVALAPGVYSISISATGFVATRGWLEVAGGRVTREDITLAIPLEEATEVSEMVGGGVEKQDESSDASGNVR